jgi:hypothetical protein
VAVTGTGSDGGQVVAELPAVVFLVLFVAAVCLQLLAWGVTHLQAAHGAEAVARRAAVTTGPPLQQVLDDSLLLGWKGRGSVVADDGRSVTVRVGTPVIIPLVGDLDVQSTAPVVGEQP